MLHFSLPLLLFIVKLPPKYCLHILHPFLHLQIALQFAPIWLAALLCQRLLCNLHHPKPKWAVSWLYFGLLVIFGTFDPFLPHVTLLFLSFMRRSPGFFLYHWALLFMLNIADSSPFLFFPFFFSLFSSCLVCSLPRICALPWCKYHLYNDVF